MLKKILFALGIALIFIIGIRLLLKSGDILCGHQFISVSLCGYIPSFQFITFYINKSSSYPSRWENEMKQL